MEDFNNISFTDLVNMNIPIIHARRMIKTFDKHNKINNIPHDYIIIRTSDPLNCNTLLIGMHIYKSYKEVRQLLFDIYIIFR